MMCDQSGSQRTRESLKDLQLPHYRTSTHGYHDIMIQQLVTGTQSSEEQRLWEDSLEPKTARRNDQLRTDAVVPVFCSCAAPKHEKRVRSICGV